MDRIRASLDAGLNVLADKPWIIHAAQLPALEAALGPGRPLRPGGPTTSLTERFEHPQSSSETW